VRYPNHFLDAVNILYGLRWWSYKFAHINSEIPVVHAKSTRMLSLSIVRIRRCLHGEVEQLLINLMFIVRLTGRKSMVYCVRV